MNKPFAESCAENQDVILEQLRRLFTDCRTVLEVGSGTGQHAVHFARHLPHLSWQTSDVSENHWGIERWIEDAGLPNVMAPIALDVLKDDWPAGPFDAVFSANTVHIMSWPAVEAMFDGIGRVLRAGGPFALYGPFHFGGQPTSDSNARFDAWLRARDPASGVRNFEDLDTLASRAGLSFEQDIEMPVNNRILVWRSSLRSPGS